ncbi:hypothetical protein F511_23589 [Dorcoceras hygrometricum]|uniref:Uncharacterized protein n=1 Tax=Dorcoceras hygrometricum TaxID=472368 RepID=A0A2Z7BWI9_9LAMI|nr:hypothetical protein F511_23589 [Dorcoceras hygrometricum]
MLVMKHDGMKKMFKSLEDTWLKGFLEAFDLVYEGDVIEFFVNVKVIVGTIVSSMGNRKMALTKDVFTEVFGLSTEGLTTFMDITKESVVEMRSLFSGSDEPFRAPNKKKGMKMEFRLLHDIVAKALCTKAGSFDVVLLSMVNNSKRQSQGFAVQVSVLLEKLVKTDLGDSVNLHPQKVLTNKSVQTYIKKNLEKPTGESTKHAEDTATNTDGDETSTQARVYNQSRFP